MTRNKIRTMALAIILFAALAAMASTASADNGILSIKNPTDDLSVKIPGLRLSDPTFCKGDAKSLCVNWIGEYIAAIYNYAIAVVGIVATIVMMFGGVLWLTAGGNAGKISEAKSWIFASFTGLMIALTSFMILNEVNPELVAAGQRPLVLGVVQEVDFSKFENYTGFTSGGGIDTSATYGKNDWDELIQQIAGKKGVNPALLKAIMAAESGGDPRATSPVGAQGLMQLMPKTAQWLGVANPYDPAQNLTGGAIFIRDLLKKYQYDLPRALAAYNWGPGNVDKKGISNLPAETRTYIQRVTTYYNKFANDFR